MGSLITKVERSFEAEEAVFQNPLLLDYILQFVIHDGEEIQRDNLAAVRLQGKNWLKSASRLVQKSNQPVFTIMLESPGTTNEVNGHPYRKTVKALLDKLKSTFGSDSCLQEDSFLPFHLDVYLDRFGNANSERLKNVLENCGDILFGLAFRVSPRFTFILPELEPLSLPTLKCISLFLDTDTSDDDQAVRETITVSRDALSPFLKFLQIILNGTSNLESLIYCLDDNLDVAVTLFESMRLPKTVSRIESTGSDFIWDYNLVMNNFLPNLQELRMNLTSAPTTDDQMFEILDRFRTSLKLFHMNEYLGFDTGTTTFLRFPLMEKLESILIQGENFALDPNTKGGVSKQLPNLRELTIDGQNEQNVMEWLDKSKYENVHTLQLTEDQENGSDVISPSLELMKGLRESFPNVFSLTLNFNYEDITALKLLFAEWTQLEDLQLTFSGDVNVITTPDLLASVFLGVSMDKIDDLRNMLPVSADKACPSPPDKDPEDGLNTQESIVNMAELIFLTLELKLMADLPDGVFDLFLDILPLAFKKMPKLFNKKLLIKRETEQVEFA